MVSLARAISSIAIVFWTGLKVTIPAVGSSVGRSDRPHRIVDTELFLAVEFVPLRLAVDERHDVIEERIGLSRIEEREDVRVLEVGGRLDLLHESLGPEHRREFGPQHFDGDLAVVLQVVGEVDVRHAARTQLFSDGIAVGEGGFETVKEVRHCVLALLATVLE